MDFHKVAKLLRNTLPSLPYRCNCNYNNFKRLFLNINVRAMVPSISTFKEKNSDEKHVRINFIFFPLLEKVYYLNSELFLKDDKTHFLPVEKRQRLAPRPEATGGQVSHLTRHPG